MSENKQVEQILNDAKCYKIQRLEADKEKLREIFLDFLRAHLDEIEKIECHREKQLVLKRLMKTFDVKNINEVELFVLIESDGFCDDDWKKIKKSMEQSIQAKKRIQDGNEGS